VHLACLKMSIKVFPNRCTKSGGASSRTVTKLVHDLGDSPGVIRFGRSVRIDPEIFLAAIKEHPEDDKIQTAVTNKNSQIKKIATNNQKT
jgi:hypothetical protein